MKVTHNDLTSETDKPVAREFSIEFKFRNIDF